MHISIRSHQEKASQCCRDVSCYKMAIMLSDRFASGPCVGLACSALETLQVYVFKR